MIAVMRVTGRCTPLINQPDQVHYSLVACGQNTYEQRYLLYHRIGYAYTLSVTCSKRCQGRLCWVTRVHVFKLLTNNIRLDSCQGQLLSIPSCPI